MHNNVNAARCAASAMKGMYIMEKNGLNALLNSNRQAKTFFGSLPDYVQGGIMLRSEEITSEEELHKCADSIFAEFE